MLMNGKNAAALLWLYLTDRDEYLAVIRNSNFANESIDGTH